MLSSQVNLLLGVFSDISSFQTGFLQLLRGDRTSSGMPGQEQSHSAKLSTKAFFLLLIKEHSLLMLVSLVNIRLYTIVTEIKLPTKKISRSLLSMAFNCSKKALPLKRINLITQNFLSRIHLSTSLYIAATCISNQVYCGFHLYQEDRSWSKMRCKVIRFPRAVMNTCF